MLFFKIFDFAPFLLSWDFDEWFSYFLEDVQVFYFFIFYFFSWQCRLFQLNIGISQKKFYQQINSLSQNITPQWKILIGHGQVGLSETLFSFHPLVGFLVPITSPVYFICSCVLLVWPITNYCDNQRRTPQFSPFHHPALCSFRWHLCFDRFVYLSHSLPFLIEAEPACQS